MTNEAANIGKEKGRMVIDAAIMSQSALVNRIEVVEVKEECNCRKHYNCCDCGKAIDADSGCGCRYCFSCNACEECLKEAHE